MLLSFSQVSRSLLLCLLPALIPLGSLYAQNTCDPTPRFSWSSLFSIFQRTPAQNVSLPEYQEVLTDSYRCLPNSGGSCHVPEYSGSNSLCPPQSGENCPDGFCPTPGTLPNGGTLDPETDELVRRLHLEQEIELRLFETARLLDETGDTRGAKAVRIVAENHANRATELLALLTGSSQPESFPLDLESAPPTNPRDSFSQPKGSGFASKTEASFRY